MSESNTYWTPSARSKSYTAAGYQSFTGNQATRDAILYQIIVIGEACKAVIAADQNRIPVEYLVAG